MKSDLTKRTATTEKLYAFDREDAGDGAIIIGVDEAGRGPLAGPVVAAAVCLDPALPIDGVNDSKKLTAGQRELLYETIVASARAWAVGSASPEDVDKINILQATFVAMTRAIEGIGISWDRALIDGNSMVPRIAPARQKTVVKGDARSASIAAASIIAKVTRDRIMNDFHQRFPEYGFDVHKGYGTELHRERIEKYGLCAIHRVSFCGNFHQTSLSF